MKAKNLLVVIFIILAGAGISFPAILSAQDASFSDLSGTVEIKNPGTDNWESAEIGGIIGKDSVISTGIKSSAVISLGASKVTVSPLTMLTLEELIQRDGTEEAILFLRTGRVKADVTPPTGLKAEFTVRSPTTTASVRGTSFSFNGRTLVVHSGKVALANNNGQKVYVNGKQRSYMDSGSRQRLALPFEAETSGMRPVFNDLENTGSQKEKTKKQTPQVSIIIDWI